MDGADGADAGAGEGDRRRARNGHRGAPVVKEGGAVVVKADAKTGRRAAPAVAGGRKQGGGGTTGAMAATTACSANNAADVGGGRWQREKRRDEERSQECKHNTPDLSVAGVAVVEGRMDVRESRSGWPSVEELGSRTKRWNLQRVVRTKNRCILFFKYDMADGNVIQRTAS